MTVAAVDDLLPLSALELARLIREGTVSSTTVMEAHIRRLQAVNPTINAAVAERHDAARAEARAGAPPRLEPRARAAARSSSRCRATSSATPSGATPAAGSLRIRTSAR